MAKQYPTSASGIIIYEAFSFLPALFITILLLIEMVWPSAMETMNHYSQFLGPR